MNQVFTASARPPVLFGSALGPRDWPQDRLASRHGFSVGPPNGTTASVLANVPARFCRACGHGWLPGVEEGDDGQDALVGVEGGVDFELAEDAVDVLFYRTLRYPQGGGDPGVGLTLGHQLQHLTFS